MRKLFVAAAAAALTVTPLSAVAAGEPRQSVGIFSEPFHEPFPGKVTVEEAAGDPRDPETCYYEEGDSGPLECLPSGASQNVLADGRVLYWNAIEDSEDLEGPVATDAHDIAGDSRSRLLTLGATPRWKTPKNDAASFPGEDHPDEPDPFKGTPLAQTKDGHGDTSMFCSDNTLLPDGRVLTVGGTSYYGEPTLTGGKDGKALIELEGLKLARIFDPKTDTWSNSGVMKHGRWYPSIVALGNGRLVAFSGVTKLLKPLYTDKNPKESGRNVAESETYDPASGEWTPNGDEKSLPLYPRMHLLPNGRVYYDAAGQAFNPAGQAYDEATWNNAAVFDPKAKKDTRAWRELGVPGVGLTPDQVGFRGSTFSQMLVLEQDDKKRYSQANFLSGGGVLGTSPGSYVPTDASRINRVDVSGATETLTTTATDPMNQPRWYGSGVTLPNGEVAVFSGGTRDHVISPGSEAPIREVEIFSPDGKGGGSWRVDATARVGRTYHNAAVLLPDGRVLVGGHDPIPEYYGPSRNGASTAGNADNRPNATFEIYTPPYLVDRPRPVIQNVDSTLGYGQDLAVGTKGAVPGGKVRLVRNPTVTHLVDADQRVVDIPVTVEGTSLEGQVPTNADALPPGPYMLFVLDAKGTPSVSKQVFIGPQFAVAGDAAAVGTADDDDGITSSNARTASTPTVDPSVDDGSAVSLPAARLANRRDDEQLALLPVAFAAAVLAAAGLGATRVAATARRRRVDRS